MLLCDLPGFKCSRDKADPKQLLTLVELDKLIREFLLEKREPKWGQVTYLLKIDPKNKLLIAKTPASYDHG
jgi:hypothetical protein